jgi:hypothetical protein
VSFLPALPLGIFAIGLNVFGNCFEETNELVVALPSHITDLKKKKKKKKFRYMYIQICDVTKL